MDDSIMECIPDSSKLNNAIGDDSLLLSALRNDVKERSIETARNWKSIVTFIFGTEDEVSRTENTLLLKPDFLKNKPTLLLQHNAEGHQDHAIMEVPQENVGKVVVLQENGTLKQDHAVLQQNFERVMYGEDLKVMFPVSHNENYLHLEDVEDKKEDWKSELDHLEGLLASCAQFVTRVDWKNPAFLCHMPRDIDLLHEEEDFNHLKNILQDDQNNFTFSTS